ncbi:hypothetical protein M0P65_01380 [Candidatus Gracilibacteria bacterium]|nr:hypothetical protein [Candidatus Gracilibacteria bacterium]
MDLYFIIQAIGINNLLDSFLKKFGNIVIKTQILKSLVYFDDIKDEKLIMKNSKYSFSFIKRKLEKIVKDYLGK